MLVSNVVGVGLILMILGIAIKLSPKNVAIAGHEAGQLLLLSALPLFFIDFATSAEYAAGTMHSILAQQNLQMYAPIADVIIAVLNIAFGGLYLYALGVFRAGGGADAASMRYLGASLAIMVAFLLLGDYIMTVVVSSLSGADQLLSTINQFSAGPILHIGLGIGIAFLTFYLTLRGRRDSARATFVVLFTYVVLMVLTFGALAIQLLQGDTTRHLAQGAILTWLYPLQGLSAYGLPKPDPNLAWNAVIGTLATSVLNGLVALTGLEAVSNGLNFIKNQDPAYVHWGKRHLKGFQPVWNYFTGRVGIGRTIQVGFLFWGGFTLVFNSFFANHFNVLDGTNGKTLVGNLAYLGLVPLGGVVLYFFRQIWSALTLSFANMTAYGDMQSLGYRDGTAGLLPMALNYRAPNGNFPRPVWLTFITAVIIIILVGGDTNTAIPYYGIGVFAPIAFMGFAVSRHLRLNKTKGWRIASISTMLIGSLSAFVFISQIVGKFEQGGWVRLVTFGLLYVTGHIILLSRLGERDMGAVQNDIRVVMRLEGAMADLLIWQTRIIQNYRDNLIKILENQRHLALPKFLAELRTPMKSFALTLPPAYAVNDDALDGDLHVASTMSAALAPIRPAPRAPAAAAQSAPAPPPSAPPVDERMPAPAVPNDVNGNSQ